MSEYVIAELAETETGGFAPRGAVKELWKTRDFECIIAGPAETGKTFGCLHYADALLWKYAGAQGVMCRKTYASLIGSALRTYQRIIGPETPIKAFGGEKPQWFDYPNGSRLWVVGLDNPGKALSSERDFFYFNQAEELLLNDWETCMTRTTGRGAVMPYTRMFGDANPGPPSHWIIHRRDSGKLRVLESRHKDNPTLYDDDGNITDQGRRSMAILDSLTGVRKLRLRDGKWAAAEGTVYEGFDRAVHVIPRSALPAIRRYVVGVDWGFTDPGVMQVWGLDGDSRMYLVYEVVRTKQTIDFWIGIAKDIAANYSPEVFVCDPSEPSYILQLQHAGIVASEGFNDIDPGVNAVRQRLLLADDKRPRLFVVDDALHGGDENMEADRLPIGFVAETDVYSYPKGIDGKPVKDKPVDRFNHSCDTARYVVAYVDNLSGGLDLDFSRISVSYT